MDHWFVTASMTYRRWLGRFLLAGVLILVAWVGYRALGDRDSRSKVERERERPVVVASPELAVASAEGEPVSISKPKGPEMAPAVASPASPALPPADAAFATQVPVLLERVNRGDPVAACRLAIGANRCATAAFTRRFVSRQLDNLDAVAASGSADVAVEILANQAESVERSRDFCDGVSPSDLPNPDVVVPKVLGALTPRQKTLLAMTLPNGQLRRLIVKAGGSHSADYLLPQVLADRTLEFLNAGFSAREPLALEGLILLHSPSSVIHAQGVMPRFPDQRRFLTYASLYRRLYGPEALGPQANLILQAVAAAATPEVRARVETDIEAEAQRWAQARGVGNLLPGEVRPPIETISDPVAACGE